MASQVHLESTTPSAPQNYSCNIYIYSGNATNQYTSPGNNSIALEAGSNTSGLIDSGCFHYGFCTIDNKFAKPSNVFLCPTLSNPLNEVQVWVENTAYWGNPLIEVLTNGTWTNSHAVSTMLPYTGWLKLSRQANFTYSTA
jgi:hypothetical protein